MKYRQELIQTAACCIAALEDFDQGVADVNDYPAFDCIVDDVRGERLRQAEKWGEPRHHDPEIWLEIIGEELGEAACEVVDLGDLPSDMQPAEECPPLLLVALAGQRCKAALEDRTTGER